MTRMPEIDGGSDDPFSWKNAAETFAESDLTLTHNDTEVSNESVQLVSSKGDTFTKTIGTTLDTDVSLGVVINPNETLKGVRVSTGGKTYSSGDIYLEKRSDGTVLDSAPSGTHVDVDLMGDMAAGTDYLIVDRRSSVEQIATDTHAYPSSTPELDITDGWRAGGVDADWYIYDEIAGYRKSMTGSTTVEWPKPSDVFGWDTAKFQRTLDNEIVDVYIEESSDGGSTWTEIAGPINRGQDISADSENKCRFRVDIEAADTDNNPTLDAIYRRWVV